MKSPFWMLLAACTFAMACTSGAFAQCGDPNAGDCFEANGTPFCNDVDCCETVCAQDPFCCDNEWDAFCVNAANAFCNGGPPCDATCPPDSAEESEPCGEANTNGCGAGEPLAFDQTVCGTLYASIDLQNDDAFSVDVAEAGVITFTVHSELPCVTSITDAACTVALAEGAGECPSVVSVQVNPGSYQCRVALNLFSVDDCANDANKYYAVATFEPGGGGGSNCFEVHPEPGCDDPACETAVCEFNPLCCKVEWDADCVASALDLCGGGGGGCPGEGDCCVANGSPACDDAECCETICAADAFCCETEWDQLCADAAAVSCENCSAGPCELPLCQVEEGEPCGEALNDGCNAPDDLVTNIAVGDSVCGNFWADLDAKGLGSRDTDWYEFTIDTRSIVRWEVYAEAPTAAFILSTECDPVVLATGLGSCPNKAEACLDAGTYRCFAALGVFEGFPCGGESNGYTAELNADPVEECPQAPGQCDPANISLTQNLSQDLGSAGIACGADGLTTENFYCRSFDLSVGETAGINFEIECIQFGISNSGSPLECQVNIYVDLDGGAPTAPGIDLELKESVPFQLLTVDNEFGSVNFDPPLCFDQDVILVVEFALPPSVDGFATFDGNADGADAPTYIRSDSCGLPEYSDLADIGFPDIHWVMSVNGNECGGGGGDVCPADINGDLIVDGLDLGILLGNWDCTGTDCIADIDGNPVVDGADLGSLLGSWGACQDG
ncbi:MAG: hypothetical protein CMJ32_09735 [Phycisphaerae bacterium]|nr:hypothetical protein [Phycisphaerae bacterium]